jgi:hypothetical protein
MKALLRGSVLAAAVAAFAATASAGETGVGMKAPELKVAKWFKGSPVKLGDGKTINVIEFWATW